jgi:hypothetical protein
MSSTDAFSLFIQKKRFKSSRLSRLRQAGNVKPAAAFHDRYLTKDYVATVHPARIYSVIFPAAICFTGNATVHPA